MGKSGRNKIDVIGMKKLYAEHPSFGEKLWKWMSQHNPPKFEVDLKTWLECCNKLLKSPSKIVFGDQSMVQMANENSKYHFYNKIEVVCQVATRCDVGKFDTTVITWSMAFKCIKNIIWLFNTEEFGIIPKSEIEIVARAIVNTMTDSGESKIELYGNIPLRLFCQGLQLHLPYLNKALQRAFWAKFIDPSLKITPPLSNESIILNSTMSSMLYLTSQRYQNCTHLPVLYNSKRDGDKYETMVDRMKYYDGPILILVRHLVDTRHQNVTIMDDSIEPNGNFFLMNRNR